MARSECTGAVLMEKDGRRIIDCKTCGFMHVHPRYSEAELEKFYKNVYSESTPSYLMFEKVYNIKKWKQGGTVLDIGCWEGYQLEFFRDAGFKCTGLELNSRAAAVAASKGIDVQQVSVKQFLEESSGKKWDVINVAYILEHIVDPAGFLRQLGDKLTDDGVVIVEVPNEFSPFQLAYLKEKDMLPYWIVLPDHLNYFNKESINNLMFKTGWEVIHGETSFPMEMFLLMGDNYLGDPSVGKRSFKKVVEMERILRAYDEGLLSRIYSELYNCNVGRSIILYAKPRQKDESRGVGRRTRQH